MELRHLRYFIAVADELSFTRGAKKLRIAQPSLTRQIRDLEDDLGVRLLDRTKKKVTLTKEGEFFSERARRVLSFTDELVHAIHELDHKGSHTVNIGYVPNPFHRVLPDSLAAFEKQFPDISINLFGLAPREQIAAVKDGKLDVGFVGLLDPTPDSDLQSLLVGSYRGVALLPPTHLRARKAIVELSDLTQSFFVSLSDKSYPGYADWFKRTCEQVGIRGKIVQIAENDSALIQAVRSGLGVALLPEQIRQVPHDNTVIRKVVPPVLFSSTVVWKKDNPSAALQGYLQVINSIRKESPDGLAHDGAS
jgi:LysR family hca operon transcriptional activator